jgi:hypothetical protein
VIENRPSSVRELTLAMADLGTHAAFLAADLPPALASLFRSHISLRFWKFFFGKHAS